MKCMKKGDVDVINASYLSSFTIVGHPFQASGRQAEKPKLAGAFCYLTHFPLVRASAGVLVQSMTYEIGNSINVFID